jgi:hypothetical protein
MGVWQSPASRRADVWQPRIPQYESSINPRKIPRRQTNTLDRLPNLPGVHE